MDFAPYQDTDPAATRALSPPPPQHRALSPTPNHARATSPPSSTVNHNAAFGPSTLPPPNSFAGRYHNGATTTNLESGRLDLFETSLPLRLDHEAMLAYLLLPPAGGVLLLVMEHKSDYVRFHAWQSSLFFSAIFLVHLIFSWSPVISWIIFAFDIVAIALLSYRAYVDADALDRFEVPFFGGLASSFVDSE